MLLAYEPGHDYSGWMSQVSDSATSFYVQRTNQRIVTADVFAAEYVSASMFEARLLQRRGPRPRRPAQSAIWADVPALTSLESPDLVKVLRHEDAIADLRDRVRVALATARSLGDEVDAMTDLAHDLESASHKLEKKMSADRFWQGISPAGFGAAGLVIGGFSGGIPGLLAGAVGAAAGLTPFLGSRRNDRREAAYLFLAARRASRN